MSCQSKQKTAKQPTNQPLTDTYRNGNCRIVPRGIGSNLGSNVVAPDFSAGAALGAEIFFTALLVFVVHSTACTTSNNVAPMAPLAIGLSVFLAHAVMLPIDGCSINPARSFGPALVSNTWGDFWVSFFFFFF